MIYAGYSLLGFGLFLLVWASVADKPFFKKLFATCLITVFVGIIFIFYDRIEEITVENIGSIKTAVVKANEEANEIQKIREQLEGQAEKINKMSEEATSALQEIQKVQDVFDSMKKYGELARINFKGQIALGGGGSFASILKGWDGDFVELHKDQKAGIWKIKGAEMCSATALEQYRSVVNKYPFWPFSHYILAICLKGQNDKSWENHASKAFEILEKTTEVPNHNPDHSLIMQGVKKLLQN